MWEVLLGLRRRVRRMSHSVTSVKPPLRLQQGSPLLNRHATETRISQGNLPQLPPRGQTANKEIAPVC